MLHLGFFNILIAISALLTFFLLTTSKIITKGVGFDKRAGTVISFNINKRAGSNKAVQGNRRFPKRINAYAHLLET